MPQYPSRPYFRSLILLMTFIGVTSSIYLFSPYFLNLASLPKPANLLRIAAPDQARTANALSPYGPGFEQELIERFCSDNQCSPEWINAETREEALAWLAQGKVDLVVGFGGDHTADPATPRITSSKAYAHFKPIRIRGIGPALTVAPAPNDPASNEALLPTDRASITPPPLPLFSAAMDLDQSQEDDALLLDPATYALWLPLLGDVRTEKAREALIPYRWFWRDVDTPLATRFRDFWNDQEVDLLLTELTERYYGFLPSKPSPGDLLDLKDMLSTRLPKYREAILKAAKENGIPPLLLVAVIYQESRFDPEAVSPTRVRGIMQLTTETARLVGVDRTIPDQAIMGGAKYLRSLWDLTENKDIPHWDRWFMALAAYNQGPGGLSGATRRARSMGKSGTQWADLKMAYPYMTSIRGYEAIAFVERIRYYYYILYGLVALSPAEAEHLAPLLSALPARRSLAPSSTRG